MYNYSFETTYQVVEGEEGDTKYREEFLKAFNMEEYDDKVLTPKLEELYKIVKDECTKNGLIEIMKVKNPFPFDLDDFSILILFFSFGYFQFFHKCIRDFFTKGYFTESSIIALKESFNK